MHKLAGRFLEAEAEGGEPPGPYIGTDTNFRNRPPAPVPPRDRTIGEVLPVLTAAADRYLVAQTMMRWH
jgi:hypothetical protein